MEQRTRGECKEAIEKGFIKMLKNKQEVAEEWPMMAHRINKKCIKTIKRVKTSQQWRIQMSVTKTKRVHF